MVPMEDVASMHLFLTSLSSDHYLVRSEPDRSWVSSSLEKPVSWPHSAFLLIRMLLNDEHAGLMWVG